MKLFNRDQFLNEGKFDKLFGVKIYDDDIAFASTNTKHLLDVPALKDKPKIVNGDLICSYNSLTSLEGCPSIIKGKFNCGNNQITTLEDGPEEVGDRYLCGNNLLRSLKGVPEVINGNFSCDDNKLDNLDYAPKEVNGDFSCYFNSKLTKEMLQELRNTSSISGKIKNDHGDF